MVKCPLCRKEVPVNEYGDHYDSHKKGVAATEIGVSHYDDSHGKVSSGLITAEVLGELAFFGRDIDGDQWVDLYLQAAKKLGKVLGKVTAEHLWSKFINYNSQITVLWMYLDKDNREIIVEMINMWRARKA